MSEHQYIAAGEKDEAELNRLRILERIFDPQIKRHLDVIGVSEGWKCFEGGAGSGSVAQWLSTRVGSAGKVVATDVNIRFLRLLSAPNLEIHQLDMIKDEVEKGHYDLVYCRTLLMQLPEPEKALKKMADALRPGGWLLIEEFDWGSELSVDVTNPSSAVFTTTLRAMADFLRKRGMVDPYFGREGRSLLEKLGLVDVKHEGWTCMVRGGEPLARFDGATLQMASKPMIAAGLLKQEDLESVQRLLQDPTFGYPGPTMFSAWGKKPV